MAVELPGSEEESAARVDHRAGRQRAWPAARSDIPASFVAQLYGARGAGGRGALWRGRPRRAGRAGLRFSGRARAGRAENPLRDGDAARLRRAQVDLGDRDRQRRHAVPGRLGDGRARRAPARGPAGGASDLRRDARRRQARRARRGRRRPPARAKASSISMSSRSRTMPRATDIVARAARPCSPTCGWRCRTGARCWRASQASSPSSRAIRRRCRWTRSRKRSSSWNGWSPTTSPSSACATTYCDGNALEPDLDSALGILRARELRVLRARRAAARVHAGDHGVPEGAEPADHHQGQSRSRVHRRVYLDYIGVKRFDAAGNLIGEFRIIGLFTSTAYTRSARTIPYLRRKVASVEQRAGFDPDSHSGKALVNVLENYPRDELFQIDEDTLYRFALAILQLDERPRVRVLARRDRFDRFVSVLVFVPRERYDSDIRAQDRRLSRRRLHRAGVGVLSVLPGRAAGARALHHRPRRRRDARSRSRHARMRSRRDRAHLDRRPRGGARAGA